MTETLTEIALIKQEMKQIAKQVDEGFSNVSRQFEENSKEHKEIVALFEKAMEAKAGRWVEKVVIYVGSLILGAIIAALLKLILIP